MRLFILTLLGLYLALVATVAADDNFDGVIRMGGSSTLLPVIAECANTFMEKYHTWDKVDAALPNKQILIFVTGGGSGFGVNAATNGAVDIGMATRTLKDEEIAKIGEHETHLVGQDCLAPVTSKESPRAAGGDNVTRNEAAQILTGAAKTWKAVEPKLADKPIVVLIRDMAGSANELVHKEVLKDKNFSPDALQLPSMGAMLKKVEENENAFAFLSSGMAYSSDKLRIYAYEGVKPSNENVIAGKYALSRPMLLIVKGKSSPAQQAFMDFVLGEGQKVVESHGYVPVKATR